VTIVYLARHGESDWNAANRFQGHSDRPLTELGRRQAQALADELAEVSTLAAIYSSPLRRASETAFAVGERVRLEPVLVEDLREVDVGSWTGLTRAEVEARHPADFRRWLDGGEGWEDGESYAAMSARVLPALLGIAAGHEGDEILVISHGGPLRAIQAAAAGLELHEYRRLRRVEPNAGLSRVAVENGTIARLD
jgi:broad specificity phosphatase PhoE